jgi:hypothetical protein
MRPLKTASSDPFLFCARRPGWARDPRLADRTEDRAPWRWISFDRAAARIAQWRRCLCDVPAGERIAISGSPSIEALMADLAARSLGLVVVHLDAVEADGEFPGSGARLRLDELRIAVETDDHGSGHREMESAGVERRGLEDVEDGARGSAESEDDSADQAVGGCVVRDATGLARELGSERLGGAVRRIESLLGTAPGRHVIVHGRSLADANERLLVEWAVWRAAAVIVLTGREASAGAIARAAFELRPSILHGSARELAEWAREFRRAEGSDRGIRKRFAALQWVVVTGQEEPGLAATSFYTGLGAAILAFDEAWLFESDRLSSRESVE